MVQMGKCKESLEAFKQALKLDLNNLNALFNQARAYDCLGEDDNAIDSIFTLLEIDPDNEDALEYLDYYEGY